MANLYWVGGTGAFDDITHWAASSGGAGGVALPTAVDSIFFDALSGSGSYIVTISTGAGKGSCKNLNTVGFTGTITGSGGNPQLSIYGNALLGPTGTFAPAQFPVVTFLGSGFTHNITCNGQSFGKVILNDVGGTYNLLDDFFSYDSNTTDFTFSAGTLNANGHNVTCRSFLTTTPVAKTLNMGSGLWTLSASSGEVAWDVRNGVVALNKGTANMYLSRAAGVNRFIYTGGFAYNKLTIGGIYGLGGILSIYGGGSFTEIASEKVETSGLAFDTAFTTTVTTFTAQGGYSSPLGISNLYQAIDDTQTTGIAIDTQPFNYPTNGTIRIDNEVISYTGFFDNGFGGYEFTGVTRGANGTTKAAHAASATVYSGYYFLVQSTLAGTKANIITTTPSGVFYAGQDSINSGNTTGITFSAGGTIDYWNAKDLNFTVIKGLTPSIGYSGVANQIQTTPGNALGAVGNANAGIGDDVGGNGVVDRYSGVS